MLIRSAIREIRSLAYDVHSSAAHYLDTGAFVVGVSGTLAVRSVINHSPVATLRGA